jgi:mannose-6-phosphate isomerase-like protein (cupin superfamily)
MPTYIPTPTVIPAAGSKPKLIEEFVGRVNTPDAVAAGAPSIARMRSPSGWVEPGQTPEFDEYTVVLKGMLRVEYRNSDQREANNRHIDVRAGEAIITRRGEWIRYSTPEAEGAEYLAVCLPAFSPATVNRDE